MAEKLCPHCNHAVPPEFVVMPVCMICGGDLNAQPTQVWSAVDLQGGTRFNCPSCQTTLDDFFSVMPTIIRKKMALQSRGLVPSQFKVRARVKLRFISKPHTHLLNL